jgi:hypothetical protein
MFSAGLIALMLLADEGTGTPGDAPAPPATAAPAETAPAPVPEPAPATEPAPPPPLPEPPPPRQRRYGDKGSMEIGIGIGYSTETGFVGAASGRYYVIDRVAPGIEGTFVAGNSDASRYGLLLAALRVLPVRVYSLALVLTGRAGRVLLGDHPDGWGVGGAAGVLFLFSPYVGLELGYEALQLLPSSFCADLESCWIHGPVIAIRFGF